MGLGHEKQDDFRVTSISPAGNRYGEELECHRNAARLPGVLQAGRADEARAGMPSGRRRSTPTDPTMAVKKRSIPRGMLLLVSTVHNLFFILTRQEALKNTWKQLRTLKPPKSLSTKKSVSVSPNGFKERFSYLSSAGSAIRQSNHPIGRRSVPGSSKKTGGSRPPCKRGRILPGDSLSSI